MNFNISDKITNNQYLNLYNLRYDNVKDNNTINYYIASRRKECDLAVNNINHEHCDAVMIVPIYNKDSVVLIKQFRPAINDYIYEFPAGLVDQNESIEEAAKRELFEETGLQLNTIVHKFEPMYTSVGMSDETVAIYTAHVSGMPTNKFNEGNEDIEIKIIGIDKLDNFCQNNLIGLKTMLLCSSLISTRLLSVALNNSRQK